MSKELVIVIGIPYSGRTTWVNKNYTSDTTKVVEESCYEKFYKDGKVQENEFYNSFDWVNIQVKELMESSTERIIYLPYQCRPDHWLDILNFAKTFEYKVTLVKPKNGILYYSSNKLGTSIEQINWIQKVTENRFPKMIKEKNKSTDEEEVKENLNLYNNIVNEFQSALAFILQNKNIGNEPEKIIGLIENQFKPVIQRFQQTRTNFLLIQTKEAEKAAKIVREAEEKLAKESKIVKENNIDIEINIVNTEELILQS